MGGGNETHGNMFSNVTCVILQDQSGCIDETELASLLNDMGLTDEKVGTRNLENTLKHDFVCVSMRPPDSTYSPWASGYGQMIELVFIGEYSVYNKDNDDKTTKLTRQN